MMWFYLILAAVILIPVVVEFTRERMTDKVRADAPGEFARLSQGLTHFEWIGPEHGHVVVCIHGLTTPSPVWRSLAEELALTGCRVLTYDLYGRGFSDRPRGNQDGTFFVTQLNDLLEFEDIQDDFSIIGYSMGGAIATVFTAAYPARVRELILLAPAGMGIVAGKAANFIARTPSLGDWLTLATYPFQLRKGISAERAMPNAVPEICDLQENELRFRGFVPAVLASFRGLLGNALEAEHKVIHDAGVPVQAIWGREDEVIPLAAAETLAQWSPYAVQDVVDGAGHGLLYTHTPEVLEIILETLEDQD